MREIKFRAWWKDTMEPIIDFMKGYTMDVLNDSPDNPFIYSQYTGLHDKNGKEIWEGDVANVKPHQMYGNPTYSVMEVVWSDIYTSFSFRGYYNGKVKGDFFGLRIQQAQEIEVIGNIYENPELVEVEGE